MDENNEKLLMTLQPILLPLLWWHNRRLPPYSSTMQAKTAIALLSYVQTGNPIQPPRAQFPDRANSLSNACRFRVDEGGCTRVCAPNERFQTAVKKQSVAKFIVYII